MFHGNVRTTSLAQTSLLQPRVQPGDFVDCYSCDSTPSAHEAARAATHFPIWVYALLILRQLFVLPFRLKGAVKAPQKFGIPQFG